MAGGIEEQSAVGLASQAGVESSTRNKVVTFDVSTKTTMHVEGGNTEEMCCEHCTYDDWKETILDAPVPIKRTLTSLDVLVSRISVTKGEFVLRALKEYAQQFPTKDSDKYDVRDAAVCSDGSHLTLTMLGAWTWLYLPTSLLIVILS